MTSEDFNGIIDYIVEKSVDLKNKYVKEELEIDYVCIFSQSKEEYDQFIDFASSFGEIAQETKTGPVFKFNNPPQTTAGQPKLLKIRIPDPTRPQRGDVDFNTDYDKFKAKYLDNERFTLIKREDFEMVELRDEKFDVLVYFSMIPLSRTLRV